MDHKSWLWRKKSSEKTIVVNDKVNLPSISNGEEALASDKTIEWEASVKSLNEKLSSALSECNARDDLVTKHAKVAEEALAGWEKAEAEAVSLKQELDEALRQRVAAEDRTAHLDAALKECMQQLRFVRDEQEQRIHDAVMKTSKEHEKTQMVLEEKLAETSKRLSKLGVENTHLSKALQAKEKLVEDLSEHNSQAEADFNALMARLVSTEKENTSLKYELCMLEKELEIRNEEREFNRRSADASHRQHLESVKKIAKLETECQRLRLLVRKRLPGPAALAKMKIEVEMLGREPVETRSRKLNPPMNGLIVKEFTQDNSVGSASKRINYLLEQLCAMEEENKTLKETLSHKNNELESSRIMCAHTASKLSQIEVQFSEFSKGQTTMELARNNPVSQGLSLASISEDDGNEDGESWASALISELEHFRSEKPRGPPSCKTVGSSDISLMDDFVEMEKLAIVSVDKSFGSSHLSPNESNKILVPLETGLEMFHSEATGKELVPVADSHSGFSDTNQELQLKNIYVGKYPNWMQDVLRIILEQSRVTSRTPYEIIEDIRTALADINHPGLGEVIDAGKKSSLSSPSESPHISGYISWRPSNASPVVDSFDPAPVTNISSKEICTKQLRSSLSESICKIIELIEGISQPSLRDYGSEQILSEKNEISLPYKNSAVPAGYMVRVFQWKSSELSAVLDKFVHTCSDLLNGKVDVENFVRDLTSALDWIMNHCFSLQDVSSMKDTIKKHFDWDESRSESDLGVGMNSSFSETEKLQASDENPSCLSLSAAPNSRNCLSHMVEIKSDLKEENRRLNVELRKMESAKKDLERKLLSSSDKIEALMSQFQESEKIIAGLQKELETLKETKGMIEDQIENHKLLNEDLNTQLTVARVELNEARQKFSSLEVELDDKSNSCQELEATCLELQLQLESVAKKEIPKYGSDQEGRQLQTNWEITAASAKLAECQETILSLGKQLKALASPREASLLDKVISISPTTATRNKNMSHRSSLLDQMLAEDDAEVDDLKSPKMKEIICTTDHQKPPSHPLDNPNATYAPSEPVRPLECFSGSNETKYKTNYTAGGALAIVPIKKRGGGGGLLRKLLMRRKKANKKMPLPMVA